MTNIGDHPLRQMLRAAAIQSENVRRKIQEAVPEGDDRANVDFHGQIRKGVVKMLQWNIRHQTDD